MCIYSINQNFIQYVFNREFNFTKLMIPWISGTVLLMGCRQAVVMGLYLWSPIFLFFLGGRWLKEYVLRRRTAVVWKTGNEGSSAAAYILHHTVLSVILTPPTVVYIDSCWQQGWGYNRRSEHSITTEDKQNGKLYEHEQSKKGGGSH